MSNAKRSAHLVFCWLAACAQAQGRPVASILEAQSLFASLQTAGENHGFVTKRGGAEVTMQTNTGDAIAYRYEEKHIVMRVQPYTNGKLPAEIDARYEQLKEIGDQLLEEAEKAQPASAPGSPG